MKIEKYMKTEGALIKPSFREIPEENISSFKGNRSLNVENIIVTVLLESGEEHSFQGDEDSQNRFVRAGWAMDKMSVSSTKWKTVDNIIVDITVNDIANIILKAGIEQTKLWF